MKVSSNRKLAFMLFRELLEKSKGSLFDSVPSGARF